MNKISIVGAGHTGATIAYTLAINGYASEIVLIDIQNEKAQGEAMDISHAMSFIGRANIYAGSYADAAGSDIVVVTSGVGRKPGQSRLDLARTNVEIAKKIIPEITKAAPEAIYVIVSNPVDIITYAFHRYSDLPERNIIGTGNILDTARLRSCIAEKYSINNKNVHALVFGEHGDSSFIPWSLLTISNIPIDIYQQSISYNMREATPLNHAEVEEYVRRSGAEIIARKGATFYAIALSVTHICKCVLNGLNTSLTVSAPMHGEYGVKDVCLSTLSIVGEGGLGGKLICRLTDDENRKLIHCGEVLKETIKLVF